MTDLELFENFCKIEIALAEEKWQQDIIENVPKWKSLKAQRKMKGFEAKVVLQMLELFKAKMSAL